MLPSFTPTMAGKPASGVKVSRNAKWADNPRPRANRARYHAAVPFLVLCAASAISFPAASLPSRFNTVASRPDRRWRLCFAGRQRPSTLPARSRPGGDSAEDFTSGPTSPSEGGVSAAHASFTDKTIRDGSLRRFSSQADPGPEEQCGFARVFFRSTEGQAAVRASRQFGGLPDGHRGAYFAGDSGIIRIGHP